MTYMPADNLRNQQQQIDQRFHEYKLAALTGLMSQVAQVVGPGKFSVADADAIAVICDMVARAMAALDLDESGEN